MADRSGPGWSKKFTNFKHVHSVIHQVGSGNDAWAEYDEDVIQTQTRGLQRPRKQKPAAEASDPPPADRPPLGYPQHFTSDPGPHAGRPTWSSQQPQTHYYGNHNQSSYHYEQQGSTHPPQNSYGHSHQSSASPPPTSAAYGSYGQGYPPPPGSSGPNYGPASNQVDFNSSNSFSQPYENGHRGHGQYQNDANRTYGSQSSLNYTVSPTSYGPVSNQLDSNSSNSFSQPYDNGHRGHGQYQNDAIGTYGNTNSGPRPNRVASAPGLYGCPYNLPNDGS